MGDGIPLVNYGPDPQGTWKRGVGAQPKSRVRPLKRRYAHNVLLVEAVGGVGFRGECGCGWKGGRRDTYAEARAELAAHRGEAHP